MFHPQAGNVGAVRWHAGRSGAGGKCTPGWTLPVPTGALRLRGGNEASSVRTIHEVPLPRTYNRVYVQSLARDWR